MVRLKKKRTKKNKKKKEIMGLSINLHNFAILEVVDCMMFSSLTEKNVLKHKCSSS